MPEKEHVEDVAASKGLTLWDGIKNDETAITSRISDMIINGKKLNGHEVKALAAYSMSNDLNPFNGEAWFIPGVGPIPGISGYRKKGRMALTIEAKESRVRAPYFHEVYFKATPEEIKHNPDRGDIAYKCVIKDNVSATGHADIMTNAMERFLKAGVDPDEAYKAALKIAGDPPEWTGYGIVWGYEKFSKEGRGDMFAREERAMKRACKVAIKKRWPSLDLPTYSIDDVEPYAYSSIPSGDHVVKIENPNEESKDTSDEYSDETTEEIIESLGFTEEKQKPKQKEEKKKEPENKEEEGVTIPPLPGDSTSKIMSQVAKGEIPYVNVKDAKEIIDSFKGHLWKSWTRLWELSDEREKINKKADQQQSLGI